MKRTLKKVKSRSRQKEIEETGAGFTAMHLVHDPQSFSEKLLAMLKKSTDGFNVKLQVIYCECRVYLNEFIARSCGCRLCLWLLPFLLFDISFYWLLQIMHVISRMMAIHKLQVLGFHPFIQRYLKPSQPEVHQLLAFTAQATHELLPPDVVQPVLTTLVNEFVSDRSSSEAQAAGLNTIREICVRCVCVLSSKLDHHFVCHIMPTFITNSANMSLVMCFQPFFVCLR
jgi:protein SDA1